MVRSYLDNLEQGQTETAHAIRELISKPLSSMIAILDKQGVEEGRGPRCTIMLMHCRPSRFQYAKADFHAFVAERCEMISSLVNRLCDGEPRKAEDGPTWSASAN